MKAYTSNRFFSNDTVFDPSLLGPTLAREDSEYFYDANDRRIAHKGFLYQMTRKSQDAIINRTIALEQFDELGPVVVRHVASFLWYYIQTARPAIPGCQATRV